MSVDSVRTRFITSSIYEMLSSNEFCTNAGTTTSPISLLLNDGDSNYTEESINLFKSFQEKLNAEQTAGVKSGLQHILQNLHHFENVLVFYNENHWIARMMMLILFNFTLFLVVSTILTMSRNNEHPPLKFMTSYFILPCFFALVCVVWLVTALVSTGAIMNSGAINYVLFLTIYSYLASIC